MRIEIGVIGAYVLAASELLAGVDCPLATPFRLGLDANDSGSIDISDAVFVFAYLFLGGPAPGDPFPNPGSDATPDGLDCLAGT